MRDIDEMIIKIITETIPGIYLQQDGSLFIDLQENPNALYELKAFTEDFNVLF